MLAGLNRLVSSVLSGPCHNYEGELPNGLEGKYDHSCDMP